MFHIEFFYKEIDVMSRPLNPDEYLSNIPAKCPADQSDVTHEIIFQRSTDPDDDDIVQEFHCSRDSKCVKCRQNYL